MPNDDASTARKRALELFHSSATSFSSPVPSSPLPASSDQASPFSSPTKKKKNNGAKKTKFANDPVIYRSQIDSPSPSSSSAANASGSASQRGPAAHVADRDGDGDGNRAYIARALASVDPHILETRKNLPIWAGKDAIVEAVRQNDTVVILGETGSGKTTQIPQFLFEAGFAKNRPVQMIGITQPRRVAATSLARRVAVEMGCPDPASRALQEPGRNDAGAIKGKAKETGPGLVGYSIRFDDRTSKRTRIKYMTDGMVLREMIGNGDFSRMAEVDDAKTSKSKQHQQQQPMAASDGRHRVSLRAAKSSTLLSRYSVLIIDEAHERTLRTDMVLGLAKRIQRERKALRADWIRRGRPADEDEVTELKIVVMSATLDAKSFANFFGSPSAALADSGALAGTANGRAEVPILYVKGRQHAVTMFHTEEPSQEWTDAALRTILQIHVSRPPGDVLVFMTGQEEIETLAKSLETYARDLPVWAEHEKKAAPMELMVAPLYAALGPSASVKVFAPTPPQTRKVVLATNIAETSITIPGIIYVIDCGLAKEKVYTPTTGVESLQTQEVSQSAARQRAGRAGRERSGECYRLYTEEAFRSLPLTTMPEILRTDLAGAVLQLCAMGQDPYRFDWMDAPDTHGLRDAVLQLIQLGALEIQSQPTLASVAAGGGGEGGEGLKGSQHTTEGSSKLALTAVGQKMAMLPVAPAYARALVAASKRGPKAARQVRDMIAVLSADRSVLLDPSDPDKRDEANRAKMVFVHPSGDHATLLNVLYAYLAEQEAARKIYQAKHRRGSAGGGEEAAASTEARQHVRAWCQNHFVHEKAVKNVLHIRKQLAQICTQQGILCDDAPGSRGGGGSGGGSASGSLCCASDGASESDSDDGGDEETARLRQLRQGLYVTRKGVSTIDSDGIAGAGGEEERYEDLRRCMLEGRFGNAALRTPEGTWKRVAGGQPFRLHPSSTLHAFRRSGNAAATKGTEKIEALLVEEVIVTTQTYARTCSVIEPAWLQELLVQGQKK